MISLTESEDRTESSTPSKRQDRRHPRRKLSFRGRQVLRQGPEWSEPEDGRATSTTSRTSSAKVATENRSCRDPEDPFPGTKSGPDARQERHRPKRTRCALTPRQVHLPRTPRP